MRKRLERFGKVRIVDETNGFGLDFIKKTESGIWSTTPDVGAVLFFIRLKIDNLTGNKILYLQNYYRILLERHPREQYAMSILRPLQKRNKAIFKLQVRGTLKPNDCDRRFERSKTKSYQYYYLAASFTKTNK